MPDGTLHHLLPRSTTRLAIHFLLHPEWKLHFRALKEHTGLGTGSLQRELAKLETLGLLKRVTRRGKVYFEAVVEHPTWNAFRALIREHADPADVLREALSGLEGIRAAFIFGSTVKGDTRPDSDVDLFLVEEPEIPLVVMGHIMLDAEVLLDREIDVIRYTPEKLAQRFVGPRNWFLRRVLSGPKLWLVGSEEHLVAVPEAA